MDLLVEDSAANLRLLLQVLTGFGEGFAAELSLTDFDEEEGAIRIVEETEQCQIDLFTRMSGRRYVNAITDADILELRGFSIPYASKQSLIAWKEGSVREKDQLDALALRKLLADPKAFE